MNLPGEFESDRAELWDAHRYARRIDLTNGKVRLRGTIRYFQVETVEPGWNIEIEMATGDKVVRHYDTDRHLQSSTFVNDPMYV